MSPAWTEGYGLMEKRIEKCFRKHGKGKKTEGGEGEKEAEGGGGTDTE